MRNAVTKVTGKSKVSAGFRYGGIQQSHSDNRKLSFSISVLHPLNWLHSQASFSLMVAGSPQPQSFRPFSLGNQTVV